MNKYRILHVATDEKFIGAANFVFEQAFPGSNTFLIIKAPANPPLRYVKAESNFEVLVQDSDTVALILRKAINYSIVILHGLDSLKARLFIEDKVKSRYVWMLWGAEVYNSHMIDGSILGPKTEKIASKLSQLSLLERLKNIYRRVRYSGAMKVDDLQSVIYSMPNMGILYAEEFDFFKEKSILNPKANHILFTYYPLEFIFKEASSAVTGNNILLGNSASYSNNHFEAIDILAQLPLDDRKVYIPLSYGNMSYAKKVIAYGNGKMGGSITPLQDFLPLEKYNEIMATCGIVIMNLYRQQAVGNILASLYLGAKVFLNNTTLYQYLKRIGCHVFLIEEDLEKKPDALELLSADQVQHNRNIMQQEISTRSVVKNLQQSFQRIF